MYNISQEEVNVFLKDIGANVKFLGDING